MVYGFGNIFMFFMVYGFDNIFMVSLWLMVSAPSSHRINDSIRVVRFGYVRFFQINEKVIVFGSRIKSPRKKKKKVASFLCSYVVPVCSSLRSR